jgi:hypothetical protein
VFPDSDTFFDVIRNKTRDAILDCLPHGFASYPFGNNRQWCFVRLGDHFIDGPICIQLLTGSGFRQSLFRGKPKVKYSVMLESSKEDARFR